MKNPRDIPPDNLPVVEDEAHEVLFSRRPETDVGIATPTADSGYQVSKRGQEKIGRLLKEHCRLDIAVDSREMKNMVENLMSAYLFLLRLAAQQQQRHDRRDDGEDS